MHTSNDHIFVYNRVVNTMIIVSGGYIQAWIIVSLNLQTGWHFKFHWWKVLSNMFQYITKNTIFPSLCVWYTGRYQAGELAILTINKTAGIFSDDFLSPKATLLVFSYHIHDIHEMERALNGENERLMKKISWRNRGPFLYSGCTISYVKSSRDVKTLIFDIFQVFIDIYVILKLFMLISLRVQYNKW